jgi:hypothetical protein
MLFTISGVVWLALDASDGKKMKDGVELVFEEKYAVYALSLAILVPFHFSFKHFLIRKYKGSYNHNFLPVDSSILEMGACTVFTFVYAYNNGLEFDKLILGTFAGLGLVFGRIFIALAVAEGQAGPSQAIMSTNSVYLTIFAITID